MLRNILSLSQETNECWAWFSVCCRNYWEYLDTFSVLTEKGFYNFWIIFLELKISLCDNRAATVLLGAGGCWRLGAHKRGTERTIVNAPSYSSSFSWLDKEWATKICIAVTLSDFNRCQENCRFFALWWHEISVKWNVKWWLLATPKWANLPLFVGWLKINSQR